MARYDTARTFLAKVASEGLEMQQFDVKTAFLYRNLEEEIYMSVPEGLEVPGNRGNYALRLRKFLYGLKQASRCWSKTISDELKTLKFKASDADKSLFKAEINGHFVYILLFVDDGLIACKDRKTLSY